MNRSCPSTWHVSFFSARRLVRPSAFAIVRRTSSRFALSIVFANRSTPAVTSRCAYQTSSVSIAANSRIARR